MQSRDARSGVRDPFELLTTNLSNRESEKTDSRIHDCRFERFTD